MPEIDACICFEHKPQCDCQEAAREKIGLKDLAKFAAWAIGIIVLFLIIGAIGTSIANASPLHRYGGHHVHRHHVNRSLDRSEVARGHSGFATFGFGNSLVSEARSQIGNGAVYGRARLWCARFVNWVLAHTGHQGTGSDMAASFARYGHRVSGPEVGSIAVMSRRGGGHVGIVSGVDASGNPIVISGNHAGHVGEATYPRRRVYAFVVPN